MIEVRLATKSDVTQLAVMQKLHRLEVEVCDKLAYDFKRCVNNLLEAIDAEGHILIVAYDDAHPTYLVGYIWVSIVQPHFSNQYYMTEHYTYVRTKHRKGRAFKKLLHEAYVCSQLTGCEYFQVACVSGIDSCSASYDKRFKKLGGVYHYTEGK